LPAIARSEVVTRRGFTFSNGLTKLVPRRDWRRRWPRRSLVFVSLGASLEAARGCRRATKRTESTRPKGRPLGRPSAMASAAGSRYDRRRAPLAAATLAKRLVAESPPPTSSRLASRASPYRLAA
jgi:hypothetical protein